MQNKRWLENYPQGIKSEIEADKYPNLVAFLESCFEEYKKEEAFECMGKSITYKQLDQMSHAFGAYLLSRGLKQGDRVGLMMPNMLQYPIALFGCLRAGLIVVNTNPLYTEREMLHQFTDSDVSAVLIADNFASKLENIIDKTNIKVVITTSIGEMLGLKGKLVDFVVRNVKKMVPRFNLVNAVKFKTALSSGKAFSIPTFDNMHEDVILHQYTGGTTGVSKGAMLTNKNLLSNMLQMQAFMDIALEKRKEVALSPLPMYHIFAFCTNCLAIFSLGGKSVLITNARDLDSVIKEFKNNKITMMTGVNTLFNALLAHPNFASQDFSALKCTIGGGMAVQKSIAIKWEKVTGVRLAEGYGMTETSPVVTCNMINGSARIGTIGMPLPSTDVKIVDEAGNTLGLNEPGELCVKGPQVMKGYYNRPAATAETIKNGWLHTGDIGQMDEMGYFRIVDRKKDMILVSGFNVYPNEIEEILADHPKILEAAAVGIKDEKSGEIVKVFIVKSDKSLTKEEVKEYCKKNFTGYKVPKQIEFKDQLPKTNVGKILRRELRE